MIQLVVKRAAWALVVLFLVVTGVFLLANAVGDPAAANLGPRASAEQLRVYRRAHGLDRPLHERYVRYLGALARGDLGRSLRDDQPVAAVIRQRLPRTALLGSLALFFELCIGLGFGIFAAVRRNTWVDTGVMSAAFVGVCLPSFVTGPFFLREVAFRLGWFPVGGYGRDALDHLYHAVLPALTLAILGAATYARMMRSEMIEMLRADFVRTARAKGASPLAVVLRHAARNALLPIVTMLGLSLPLIVTGAIITEKIYDWPGIGRLAIESIDALDVPMILGIVLLASTTVQLGNFLADLAVAALDPRIRAGSSR
jgi:peptide/nickel transport system permease protein